ncbi:plexin A3-like [Centruroides vittatus]|uniref:plexin A3-like n=1 Tax=Centruroides vittatus TaxID=120091 RepID=UPI00350F5EB2
MRRPSIFFHILEILVFTIVIAFELTSGSVKDVNYKVYENKDVEMFNKLAVNVKTGKVYIGAVNRIFQLSKDLKYQESVEMGPREDSPNCPVTRVCPDKQKLSTNYYNKVLAIDYSQSKLIACGSLFQGVCTSHDVENVTLYETPANESVVANNSTASTVAFIAPGPEDLSRTHVLYVGVSYTGNGPYCSDIPAVSSRSLDPANMFAIAHTDAIAHTGTKIMINSMSREIYPIKYVFGFSAKGFSYFITVQGKQTSSPKPFISKLIRICQNDVHYYSYTEVPLECRADDGTHYNLAQAGYVGHPGSELAVSLGITAQDDVLYVVFAKSKNDSDTYFKPSANSALCVYALSAIHRKFTQNIQDCFNGVGQRGLDFINPSQACSQTVSKII